MYAIYRKAKNEGVAKPTFNGETVQAVQYARKYRNINIADADFIVLSSQNPEYLWQVKHIKDGLIHRSNSAEVLKIWNQK